MEKRILITTTNSIENAEIERYIDLISTNIVIGTNIFSDIGASFTDLFGGFSDTYQEKLEKINNKAIENLKLKASNIGANAILGLKIDFDEISGKGKSMFMISVFGTAVSIKYNNRNFEEKVNNNIIISKEKLEEEIIKCNIILKINNEINPTQDEWIYLFNNPLKEISEKILDIYLKNIKKPSIERNSETELFSSNTQRYFKSLDKEFSKIILYNKIEDSPIPIIELIQTNNLFSPVNILELIKNDKITLAIQCLTANSDFYTENDLLLMNEISNLINNLPDKGKIENVKGLLGNSKDKFICQHGHISNPETGFCTNFDCNENIKGLTRVHLNQIEKYNNKLNALNGLMKK